jgi:hypothetical protein
MTYFLLCFSFLPVPYSPSSSNSSPSAVLQLVIALILAAWLLQLVRLAFLVFQWRMKTPASESSSPKMEAGHVPAMGKL